MQNFKEFFREFPNEDACRTHFKAYRDKVGVTCKKCQCKEHYWLSTISYYKCKSCGFRTSLKSGTVMENSKLSFTYWYMAFMFVSGTKKSFSALEIQRQIGHKFYEPVWAMMHKIRLTMGKRDAEYKLRNAVELDEGFFVTTKNPETDVFGKKIPKKRVHGNANPRTSKVLVIAESIPNPRNNNPNKPSRAVKFIKMQRIENLSHEVMYPIIQKALDPATHVLTDGADRFNKLNTIVGSHQMTKMVRLQAHTVLPWVHKVISNAKRNFLGVHHSISEQYSQNYFNEFCFKFNRRYNGFDLFDRVINAGVKYEWC